MKAKNVRTGLKGESAVKTALEKQGYIVDYPIDNFSGDLLVTCPDTLKQTKLEVKSANRGQDGSFQFCLYREGKTDVNHADVLALVFYTKKTIEIRFMDVLHVSHIRKMKFRTLPADYQGKYKSCWHKDFSQVSFIL